MPSLRKGMLIGAVIAVVVGVAVRLFLHDKGGPWGFSMSSTSREVAATLVGASLAPGANPDEALKGRVFLVTGAGKGGIGFETALAFARHGAHVVLHARSQKRADDSVAAVRAELTEAQAAAAELSTLIGDLGDKAQVRRMAADFRERNLPLHVLVLNAGVMPFASDTEMTLVDGVERTMAINHVAHALLVRELMPVLESSAPSRVVSVSSAAHRNADVDVLVTHSMLSPEPYSDRLAYGNSKMANVLWAAELNRRIKSKRVTAVSLHPGVIATDLGRDITNNPSFWGTVRILPFIVLMPIAFKTVEQGAATSVYCALAPEVAADESLGGAYFSNGHVSSLFATQVPFFEDPSYAAQLYERTEEILDTAWAADA